MKAFLSSRIPELIFGTGKLSVLPSIIERYGKNVLLVTGDKSFINSVQASILFEKLETNRIRYTLTKISHEPSAIEIDAEVGKLKNEPPDLVVSIGGGSVIDAGKAISAMLVSTEKVACYLEGVGSLSTPGKKIPFIAIPTTAGTGSEATKNAVISEVGLNGYKSSLRHNNYIPDIALLDPELQLSCPKNITAYSGMDAFTQLLESYLSTQATRMTDMFAIEGIKCIQQALIKVTNTAPNDVSLRSLMSYAAWLSGICLANAGLGTIHGFASSVGARYDIPHGVICGTLMAEVNRLTFRNLSKSTDEDYYLKKYATAGRIFTNKQDKTEQYYAELLIDNLFKMTEELDIPKLSAYGVLLSDFDEITTKTSNKNNPINLTREELTEALLNRL